MNQANKLIHESSPYLLQHAKNPINWYAWNDETLALAKRDNKIMLISIGYSACHWCHVMEHESFEDREVAEVMNRYFINVKVDREERPDIDMVYMGAVQLMTGQGGWPLNCFALPDGRPIYGGTYFPKKQWINVLSNIAELFHTNPDKVYEYANNLTAGLKQLEIPTIQEEAPFSSDILKKSITKWKLRFDKEHGGPDRAPKFPLPNNYLFLLEYNYYEQDSELQQHIDLTLTKMAWGGIYDHLGGGFARYSTDVLWKVPHFEKMLYDNAQLINLYTKVYKQSPNELYKKVVYETIAFVETELMSKDFGFYSALDADSEGVEGKYYVWQKEELKQLLKENFEVFADYYCVNDTGYWEDDNYVLMRDEHDSVIALRHHIALAELNGIIATCKEILLQERNQRVKPGLDNKILASWNGLMCKALAEAYLVFNEEKFKVLSISNANYLNTAYCLDSGKILRVVNRQTTISGFLDDYAFVTDAFMFVYLITNNESWLMKAKSITDYAIAHFYDEVTTTFFYTDDSEEKLIVRKAEWSDNVIPASSSQMAINLYQLARYFDNGVYLQIATTLLKSVVKEIAEYESGYSNWALLYLQLLNSPVEVVIVGKSVNEKLLALYKQTPPNVIFALSNTQSDLPLLKNRYVEGNTTIYVCKNNHCLLPTQSVTEALHHIEENNT